MTIECPTWEEFLLPSLAVLNDGAVQNARSIREAAASELELSNTARSETIPSGQLRWENRAHWALSYLAQAGALHRPERGRYVITDVGRALLASHPEGLRLPDLVALSGERDESDGASAGSAAADDVADLSPVERIEQATEEFNKAVAEEIIDRVYGCEPSFFEQVVLDVLMAMGYGGANGRATRTRLARDGGIDGVIDQDALGLSRIYVQAKLYEPSRTVGRPDVQAFLGALQGQRASQGVFITTGRFSGEAASYVELIQSRVVLIDGPRLASLMVAFRVGVQPKRTYELVQIDEDYFE